MSYSRRVSVYRTSRGGPGKVTGFVAGDRSAAYGKQFTAAEIQQLAAGRVHALHTAVASTVRNAAAAVQISPVVHDERVE